MSVTRRTWMLGATTTILASSLGVGPALAARPKVTVYKEKT